jgi:hypothetical protein
MRFPKVFFWIWLLGSALLWVGYQYYGKALLEQLYTGQAPAWLQGLAEGLYPRLAIERHRFDLHFFQQKAEQVLLRGSLLVLLLLVLLQPEAASFRRRLSEGHISQGYARYLQGVFTVLLFYFTWDWPLIFEKLQGIRPFYQPLSFWLRLFSFPSSAWATGLCVAMWAAALYAFYRSSWYFCLGSVLLFLLLEAFLLSFQKFDHTWASFNYIALMMPSLYAVSQKKEALIPAWPWQMIRVAVAAVYVQAGLEKILIGGSAWLEADNLRTYLLMAGQPLGEWLAQYDVLCIIFAFLVILFELSFAAIVLYRKSTPWLLAAGFCFHLSTYFLMGIGSWLSTWTLSYLFLLEASHWPPKFRAGLSKGIFLKTKL